MTENSGHVKIGCLLHETTHPEVINRKVSDKEIQMVYEKYVLPHLPGIKNHCTKSEVCLITNREDGDFVIDRHPKSDRITIVSACSGHGFKHSFAVGYLLSRQLLGYETSLNLFQEFGNKLQNQYMQRAKL